MRVILFGLVLCVVLESVAGKVCVNGHKKQCSPDAGDCAVSETCMQLPIGSDGKIHPVCGEPQDEDCACDNTLTSAEACKPGLSCQEDKKKWLCKPGGHVGPMCVSNARNWQFVYSNDANGGTLGGTNINDLLGAIREGAEVKVFSNINGAFLELLNIQKVSISFDQDLQVQSAHGQSLFWVQPFLNNGYNLYSVLSTTGNAHYTQFFINDPVNRGRVNTNAGRPMDWFVRRCSGKVNDVTTLRRVVQDGANIRVAVNDSVRHLEVADLSGPGQVQGISIEMRDKLNGLQFNTTEQWLFMHWSTDGTVIKSNWLLNTPQGTESDVITGQNIDWYADTCWQFVYRHNGQGQALSGTLSALLNMIDSGRRIKVKVGSKYHEVNVVRVNGQGVVTAQVFDSWDDNIVVATWKWLEVSSTGSVKTVELLVGGSVIISDVTVQMEVTWFAENREWRHIDKSEALGEMSNGSDFRFKVAFNGDFVWYQADSATNIFGLLNEREFVFYNNQYHRRYSFGNFPKRVHQGDYVYMDYRLGDLAQAAFQNVATDVNYYVSE